MPDGGLEKKRMIANFILTHRRSAFCERSHTRQGAT